MYVIERYVQVLFGRSSASRSRAASLRLRLDWKGIVVSRKKMAMKTVLILMLLTLPVSVGVGQPASSAPGSVRVGPPSLIRTNVRYRVSSVDPATRRLLSTNVATGAEVLSVGRRPVTATNGASRQPPAIRVLAPQTPEATNVSVLSSSKAAMPAIILISDATKDTDTAVELFLYAESIPLRWNTNAKAYACPLVVGVDVSNGHGSMALPTPLTFQLLAQNCSVSPTRVTVTNTGTAGAQSVTLTCEDPRAEATVTAFYDPSAPRKPLTVPCLRELGDIMIEAQPANIFGYGLGTAAITITRLAKDRYELFDTQNLNVAVTTSKGILRAGTLIRSNDCSARIEFRSIGIGSAFIKARVGPFSDTQSIQFTFPLGIMIGTMLGGALGGCGRIFRHRELLKHRYRIILEGALCGVLIVAAVAAGVVVFTMPTELVGSELGAFVIAGIAGYTGSVVLDRLKASAMTPAGALRKECPQQIAHET